MGKYFSCFQYKITPKIYKKKYNIDIKYEKQNTSSFYKKNKSYEDINLLTNSISPLSRHSHRKAKSMDCLFSQI